MKSICKIIYEREYKDGVVNEDRCEYSYTTTRK